MKNEMTISPLGNEVLLIQLEQKIDTATLNKVLMIGHAIEQERITGVLEIVPAYASLAVYYDPITISYPTLKQKIEQLPEQAYAVKKIKRFVWEIPVCYELGVDIQEFASEKKLSTKEIIHFHTKQEYLVYMRGFVPGFLYLGGLDERLFMQRKTTPTRKVPPGSVAIGGQQTGIYALPGPAGWHVIGQTPVKLFDPEHKDIMPINPGDKVRFKPISKGEFNALHVVGDESLMKKKPLND